MATRRRFLEVASGGMTGSWLARALPLGAGVGFSGWPGAAQGSVGTECMRLDIADVTGWQQLGSQIPSPSQTVLKFSDADPGDVSGIYLPDSCAGPGLDVDVVATFQVPVGHPQWR